MLRRSCPPPHAIKLIQQRLRELGSDDRGADTRQRRAVAGLQALPVARWLPDGNRGYSAFETGLFFLPMTVPMCFMPFITGRLVVRFGARRIILVGLALDVLAGALLAIGGYGSMGWVIAAGIALVFGSTLAIPAATADMAAAAPPHLAATGQGVFGASRQAGSALGVALLGSLSTLRLDGTILAIATVAAVALVLAAGRPRERR